MTQVQGLLLNSRMIIAFLVVELGAIIALDAYFYQRWTDVKLESIRKSLVTQVELLAQQATDLPDTQVKIKLSLPYAFQVVTEDSVVMWDSLDTTRILKKVQTPYFLLTHALKTPLHKDLIEFEEFYGAFKRNSNKMIALGAVSKKSIGKEQGEFVEKLFIVSLLIFWFSIIVMTLLFYVATFPLRRLTFASIPYLSGQLPTDLPYTKTGEVGVLTAAFKILTKQLRELMQEGIQKVQIEQEVDIAASLQKSLLPQEHLETDRYVLESYYESATKTGGDYWGYFETKKYLVMYIADATGHGLSSSMLTAAARGCFSSIQQLLTEYPEIPALPSFLLRFANRAIIDSAQDELNMTMFIATYSFDEHILHFASAGHNPAWIVTNTQVQGSTVQKVRNLNCLGSRLGESPDFEPPLDQSIPFSEDDLLFLYTDGLWDCRDSHQTVWGRRRAKKEFFNSVQMSNSVADIRKKLIEKIKSHTQGKALDDDITFALFKLKGGAK